MTQLRAQTLLRPIDGAPDFIDLHRLDPARYPVLLESAADGTRQGRWDMLFVANGESLTLRANGAVFGPNGAVCEGDFLHALDAWWRTQRTVRSSSHATMPPFCGGWALFLAYELAAQVEPVLCLPRDADLPVALALRCPAALLRDRTNGACIAVAERDHGDLLDRLVQDLVRCPHLPPLQWHAPMRIDEDAPERYLHGVRQALEHIAAGDVFQVNLSRGWQARFDVPVDASALHTRLRAANPSPFAGVFAGDGWSVVSASPERLLSVRGDRVETRPIAGTRPRGLDARHDADRIDELIGHPKERAEHVMLIDLERNDLGRVCVPGSVRVDELMTVESYAHVHHIVSNVCGRLRAEVTPGDAIRAVFPGGTITGCPKVRCMQIIAALEATPRGAYTGAIGWLDRSGDLDLNILIRSALVGGDDATRVRFRTGAGIVADSDPLRELDETRAKARGMLRALGVES